MRYLAVSALSHDGLLRDHNEDSLVIGPWTTCGTTTLSPQTLVFPSDNPVVVAVSDGLGGHPSGDVASTVVVEQLAKVAPFLSDAGSVAAALEGCNDAVYDAADLDPTRTGMGATVAGVLLLRESAIVFNVGDSRVYDVSDAGVFKASVDDNPPLLPGETHTSIVTQTLGGSHNRMDVTPHVATQPLDVGSRYLVCSDGLSDVVADDAIAEVLHDHHGLAAVFELWRAAMESGGPDNITIAVAEVLEEDAVA